MSGATKLQLVGLIAAILLFGTLLERELAASHDRRQEATPRLGLLLAPYEDAALPPVPDAAPDGGPPPGTPEVYVVKEGDTLGRIASRTLGSSRGWKAILRLNQDVLERPELLRPGMRLKVPGPSWEAWLERQEGGGATRAVSAQRTAAPTRAPGTATAAPREGIYVVRQGDTLGGISQRLLGSTRHWKAILDANRTTLPSADRLQIGMELVIPKVEAAE